MFAGVRRAILILVAACGAPAATPVVEPVAKRPDVPMSDPYEYGIDRISREAGEAIFAKTGIGDPYRTGVPYPIFLAMMRAYPQTFGKDTQELAGKFGFIAQGNELPVGMHLTTDPITGVPFVVTSCTLCHAEKVGDKIVVGLGNKRVRIHAYDAAWVRVAPTISVEKLRRLADEAAAERHIPWPEPYRDAIVGAAIDALRVRAKEREELIARVADGPPGRVATIESFVPVLAKLTDLGTDPARAMSATAAFERAANDPALTRGYTKFRRSFGYVPPVLTNVWARAPYGHAGQWPSLAVMATDPDHRPQKIVVAFDAPYDLEHLGVRTRAP